MCYVRGGETETLICFGYVWEMSFVRHVALNDVTPRDPSLIHPTWKGGFWGGYSVFFHGFGWVSLVEGCLICVRNCRRRWKAIRGKSAFSGRAPLSFSGLIRCQFKNFHLLFMGNVWMGVIASDALILHTI